MTNNNFSGEKENKSFWNTLTGTIVKVTALISAITGLILAVNSFLKSSNTKDQSSTSISPEPKKPDSIGMPPIAPHVFTPAEVKDFLDAGANGTVDILKMDLDLGLSADIKLNDGRTALANAVLNNKPEAVKILLQHQADPNIKVNENSYLIIEASYGGYTEIVDLLIKNHANLDVRKEDGSGITALMFACIRGNREIVQKLIDGHADPNQKAGVTGGSTARNYANELPSPIKEDIIAILNSVQAQ